MTDAWLRFEQLRWDGPPPSCPRCGVVGRCSLLPGADGARRVWRCAGCRSAFSVLTGTLLERTRAPLPVWAAVVGDMVSGGQSARASARRHGITAETARHLDARLRAAGVGPDGVDADRALARVLRLAPDDVERIRRTTPVRRASRYGPTGDYA